MRLGYRAFNQVNVKLDRIERNMAQAHPTSEPAAKREKVDESDYEYDESKWFIPDPKGVKRMNECLLLFCTMLHLFFYDVQI